jgi:hypothetical protein
MPISPRIPRISRHPNIIWEYPIPKIPSKTGGATSKYDYDAAFLALDQALCQIFTVQKEGKVHSIKQIPGGSGVPRSIRVYLWAGDKSLSRLNALEKQATGECHFKHFPARGVTSYED